MRTYIIIFLLFVIGLQVLNIYLYSKKNITNYTRDDAPHIIRSVLTPVENTDMVSQLLHFSSNMDREFKSYEKKDISFGVIITKEKDFNKDNVNVLILTPYHHTNMIKTSEIFSNYFNDSNKIIIIDGEPNSMEESFIKHCSYAITTKLDFHEKYKTFSYYVPYFIQFLVRLDVNSEKYFKILENNIGFSDNFTRDNFCFFAYSNAKKKYEGVINRESFYYKMQVATNNRVSNLGKSCGGSNPLPYDLNKNIEEMEKYKFTISFENSNIKGYITEKILSPLLAGAIPIYWGHEYVKEIFNPKRFIFVNDFDNFEACIDYVLKVNADDKLFEAYQNQPIFNQTIMENYYDFFSYYYGGRVYRDMASKNINMQKLLKPKLMTNNEIKFIYQGELDSYDNSLFHSLHKLNSSDNPLIEFEKILLDSVDDDILIFSILGNLVKIFDSIEIMNKYIINLIEMKKDIMCFSTGLNNDEHADKNLVIEYLGDYTDPTYPTKLSFTNCLFMVRKTKASENFIRKINSKQPHINNILRSRIFSHSVKQAFKESEINIDYDIISNYIHLLL